MPQCVRCQGETELYENGIPICLKCTTAGTEPKHKPPIRSVPLPPKLRASLLEDLFAATARTNEARRAFDLVMSQTPSGLPHPDGSQRIHNASQELQAARNEVNRAHNRL